MKENNTLLNVHDLNVSYGDVPVVKNISFSLRPGEALGIAGESGCGKSTMLRALMAFARGNGLIRGDIDFENRKLLDLPQEELRQIRGSKIAMIPQNAFLSMDPTKKISSLFRETIRMHRTGVSDRQCDDEAEALMEKLLLRDTKRILSSYPFELSGGMCQRVAIAVAMINSPRLLLGDEPTSGLDAAAQMQVVNQLKLLKDDFHVGMILVSHNFRVIAQLSDMTAVMYAGEIVEMGEAEEILEAYGHPYTKALIGAIPDMDGNISEGLPGTPPDFSEDIPGCSFAPRCLSVKEICRHSKPEEVWITPTHRVRCFRRRRDANEGKEELGGIENMEKMEGIRDLEGMEGIYHGTP